MPTKKLVKKPTGLVRRTAVYNNKDKTDLITALVYDDGTGSTRHVFLTGPNKGRLIYIGRGLEFGDTFGNERDKFVADSIYKSDFLNKLPITTPLSKEKYDWINGK